MAYFLQIIFLLLIFSSNGLKGTESDGIVVSLSTENTLMPLYLAHISSEENTSDFKRLEEILRFDLNVNGMTRVVKTTSEQENLCIPGNFKSQETSKFWKKHHIYYVVKAFIKDKKLSAHVLSVNNGSIKTIDEISLTGDFQQDRKQMHLLADSIFKALFGTEGIASTRILYTVKNKVGDDRWISEVWEADYDGGNARQMTHENSLCVSPAYIPAKTGFLSGNFFYVSYKNGQPKIFIGSSKNGPVKRLTMLRGNQLMPAISRQRDKVAFVSDVTGNPDLFLQDFSPEVGALGKPRQIFAASHATQGTPTFNPEGTQIAFVSNKDSVPRIYVIDIPPPTIKSIKDIRATLITKQNRECTAPAWSPDGKKLAYSAMTNDTRQIWIYDFNTKEERQLTKGSGHKENPVWADDSLHLIFNSSTHNGSELYLVNLNQSEAHQITSGKGEKRFPSWEQRNFGF